MGQIFDWDGTITGKPGSTIVRDQPFYTSSLCESRPNWGNMSICPHQYVRAEGTGTHSALYKAVGEVSIIPLGFKVQCNFINFAAKPIWPHGVMVSTLDS